MSRHADPTLLQELKLEWSEYGCALCGRSAVITAPSGFGVELDHVWSRGRGGPDYRWNVLGLCGELAGCKGHWRKTAERIKIETIGRGLKESPNGEAWSYRAVDTETGEALGVRMAPCYEPEVVYDGSGRMDMVRAVPGAGGATVLHGAPEANRTPQDRFLFVQGLYRDAEKRRIACAVILAWVHETKEYAALGYERIADYAADAGIPKADTSKMLQVAKAFGGSWMDLDEPSQAALSLERLYYGSRLMRDAGYSAERALEAAVVHPTDQLIALLKGDEPADMHACPTCGRVHIADKPKDFDGGA